MFTTYELTEEFRRLNEEARNSLARVVEGLPLQPESIKLSRDELLFNIGDAHEYFYLIKEGYLKCVMRGKMLFFLEAGDLVGLGQCFRREEVSISSEFAVVLDRYPRKEFLEGVLNSPDSAEDWSNYLELSCALQTELVSSLTRKDVPYEPETLMYESGETIILEDTEPDRVYTLLHGTADVYYGGKKVGGVLSGEIFGAMAVATESLRCASVIAKSPCLVFAVPKENFLALVETHPETVLKLIESMSRIIVTQNARLIELQGAEPH